ncbi:pyridoxal phosphate-dependent transferase [Pavlovales sp. CCMP2436]|nr:pyridoxal phosphate-dependent transferase [Pavlovales sp. CCMP2436]
MMDQLDMYTPRGLFLEPPSLALRDGVWAVELPAELARAAAGHNGQVWRERADALDVSSRLGSPLAAAYRRSVSCALDGAVGAALPAALVIEPVVQGAGGMILVDPLYQRVLCEEARSRGLPLVFDEVFVGLYRLGVPSTSTLLGIRPDIACYAKLLTGGTVPLAVTLATEAVFDAFRGLSKPEALLHGHSYSAHAIGCSVASAALDMYADAASNCNWILVDGQTVRLTSRPAGAESPRRPKVRVLQSGWW